jgi:hypothetical protein
MGIDGTNEIDTLRHSILIFAPDETAIFAIKTLMNMNGYIEKRRTSSFNQLNPLCSMSSSRM